MLTNASVPMAQTPITQFTREKKKETINRTEGTHRMKKWQRMRERCGIAYSKRGVFYIAIT